jgi:hypothetical protein
MDEYETRNEVRRQIKFEETPIGNVPQIAPLYLTSIITDYIPSKKTRKDGIIGIELRKIMMKVWRALVVMALITNIFGVTMGASAPELSHEVVDATTGNPITGSYIIYEETSNRDMIEIQRGNLDIYGTITPPPVLKPLVSNCIVIIPSDPDVHTPVAKCIIPQPGLLTIDIPIKTCTEAKNHVSVRTVYNMSGGGRFSFTANEIQIKLGANVVNTVIPTSDITYIDGLAKNTLYNIHVTEPQYKILNNDQQVLFTIDCGTTSEIIIEATRPSDTQDITIEVRSAETAQYLQGASVSLDHGPSHTTDATGSVFFTAIPYGNHDLKISYGYADNISTINVSDESTDFGRNLIV